MYCVMCVALFAVNTPTLYYTCNCTLKLFILAPAVTVLLHTRYKLSLHPCMTGSAYYKGSAALFCSVNFIVSEKPCPICRLHGGRRLKIPVICECPFPLGPSVRNLRFISASTSAASRAESFAFSERTTSLLLSMGWS